MGAKFFRGAPKGAGDPITRIRNGLTQNGCPNPHRKFQHFRSIRKRLQIGGTEMWGEKRHPRSIFGDIKMPYQYKTFWDVDFCNTFVCVYWSDGSIQKNYLLIGTTIKIITKMNYSHVGYLALLRQLAIFGEVGAAISAAIARYYMT